MDPQPVARRQCAFELAVDFRDVDFDLALEDAGFGDLDRAAVAQRGFDPAFDDKRVAGGNLARQTDLAADDEFLALRVTPQRFPLALKPPLETN